MNKIRIAGIINDSIVDGPGLRFVVFTQGCDKRCPGCHNPETQPLSGGIEMSVDEIFEKIKKNPILSGVTISGGEPFLQAKELIPLIEKIKNDLNLEIAVYTGNIFEDLIESKNEDVLKLISLCDIIIDGPFIKELKSLNLKFRGSSNQRIIDVKETLKNNAIIISKSNRWCSTTPVYRNGGL